MHTTKEELEAYMEEAAERVGKHPAWKRGIGIMDRYRQYNRHEPDLRQLVGGGKSGRTNSQLTQEERDNRCR